MKQTPRIIAYAWDHEGLGHVARLLAVIQGIREAKPGSEAFIVAEQDNPLLQSSGIPYVCTPTFSGSYSNTRTAETPDLPDLFRGRVARSIVGSAVETVQPSVALHDTVVSQALYEAAVDHGIPQCLILRRRKDMRRFLSSVEEEHASLELIILPHNEPEIEEDEIPATIRRKVIFAGTIVRGDDNLDMAAIRQRYGIRTDIKTIVIAGGGGGYEEHSQFFNTVASALSQGEFGPILVIVLLGYFFDGIVEIPTQNPLITWRITRHERDHSALLQAADILITQAGYNTLNEGLSLGVPMVVIPGRRPFDDQHSRVQALAQNNSTLGIVAEPDPKAVGIAIKQILTKGRKADDRPIAALVEGRKRAAAAILALVD